MKYPKIIPELDFSSSNQTLINKSSLKYWLLSTFFYSRIEKDYLIYLKLKNGKLHYMPLFTITKALACFNEDRLADFFFIAEKLIDSMDEYGWLHNNLLQLPGYPQKKISYSALINARGLGVLIRYYKMKPSKTLLYKIEKVLDSFFILSSNGGVLSSEGYYLEYSWGNSCPVVWNGFMSALIGLHDCFMYGPKELKTKSKELFDKGLQKLINKQNELFWEGFGLKWIRYDNKKLYFADGPYMTIEIRQLNYLSQVEPKLKNCLSRIKKIKNKNQRRANIYEYYYFLKKRLLLLRK
mgnify:CR=1 FL=1